MFGLGRLCAASAVAFALLPVQERLAGATRSDNPKGALEDRDGERPGESLALIVRPNHSSALIETGFLDPISLTVMSGIAAAGSIGSIGKTILDIRAQKKQGREIADVVKKYQHQSKEGCKMLDTAAQFLTTKMDDLDNLYKDIKSLEEVCRDKKRMETYTTFLTKRLKDICTWSPEAIKKDCQALHTEKLEANINEACSMSEKWDKEAAVEKAKSELHKHIWQMDGLKRGTCGKGLEGTASLSFIERSRANKSGVPIIDVLGLAFTLCGWADMLITVGDHTVSKVWSNGVQGLLDFTEHKAEEAQKAVCNTFTAIWLRSFVPGNAAKLASLGVQMSDMGVSPDAVEERLAALATLTGNEDPEGWGINEETLFLCDNANRCMVPMPAVWSKHDGEKNKEVGGVTHPDATCFGVSSDMNLVAICNENGAIINAVPRECFRMYTVTASAKEVKIGSGEKKRTIIGSSRAFEFAPRTSAWTSFAKSVAVDDEGLNLDLCVEPLSRLWNAELAASTAHLADACPAR